MSALNYWLVVLTLCTAVVGVISVFALLRLKSQKEIMANYLARTAQLEAQLDTALSGSLGMGKRIVNLEKKLNKLAAELQNNPSSVDEFSYGQALQMLKQGADVESVASNCGFSNSEAQLMQLVQEHLHKKYPEPSSSDS